MATKTPTKRPASTKAKGFTEGEKSAMRERVKELKAESTREAEANAEGEVLAKIAEMPKPDRVMAERIHEIVKASAPNLAPKLWYGMPAYAKAGKLVCFFKAADKFKSRYATFGFEEHAQLDEGTMWATSWALTRLTADDEARISALVKKAAG